MKNNQVSLCTMLAHQEPQETLRLHGVSGHVVIVARQIASVNFDILKLETLAQLPAHCCWRGHDG